MNFVNFREILKNKGLAVLKNKYSIPILIGAVIAVGGILMGSSQNGLVTGLGGKSGSVEIKGGKLNVTNLSFGKKDYDLTYADMDPSLVENISFFGADDSWKGNGFLDWKNFYEGKSSVGIISNDHQLGVISLEKDLDLSNTKNIEFFAYVNDVRSLELALVKFGDSPLANYYSYSLTNLTEGWNVIRIPINQFVARGNGLSWKDIRKIQFEVTSRPNGSVLVNFDYLTAQKNTDYLEQWKSVDDNFLSLGKGKRDNKLVLVARNEGAFQAILNGVNGSNFSYQASFIPQKPVEVGLFFRGNYGNNQGYYLLAGGVNTNFVTLKKLNSKGAFENLEKTEVANFVFEQGQKYWLKVETNGNKTKGFISIDGETFTELLSVTDDEFTSGGVGIAVFGRGYSLFNDFKFKQ